MLSWTICYQQRLILCSKCKPRQSPVVEICWLTNHRLCDIDDLPVETKEKIRQIFLASVSNGRKVSLDLERSTFGENNQTALTNGLQAIAKRTRHGFEQPSMTDTNKRMGLPRVVTFPYSRHSSYPELCHLVSAFKPKDVWPCTVNPAEWIEKGLCRVSLPQ